MVRECGHDVTCPVAKEVIYTLKERAYVEQIETAFNYASRVLLDFLMEEQELVAHLRYVPAPGAQRRHDRSVCPRAGSMTWRRGPSPCGGPLSTLAPLKLTPSHSRSRGAPRVWPRLAPPQPSAGLPPPELRCPGGQEAG